MEPNQNPEKQSGPVPNQGPQIIQPNLGSPIQPNLQNPTYPEGANVPNGFQQSSPPQTVPQITQINTPTQPIQSSSVYPNIPTGTATTPQPHNYSSNFLDSTDSKIRQPKYWLTMVGVLIIYGALYILSFYVPYANSLSLAIFIILVIIAYLEISKLKKKNVDDFSSKDKIKMIAFMTFSPIITQALYYYRLRKKLPNLAKIALKVGWKVFGIAMAIGVFEVIGIIALNFDAFKLSVWNENHRAEFMSAVNKINKNITDVSNSTTAEEVRAGCTNLKTDSQAVLDIVEYPVEETQTAIDDSINVLSKAADDCITSINTGNQPLFIQAGEDVEGGYTSLSNKAKEISGNK